MLTICLTDVVQTLFVVAIASVLAANFVPSLKPLLKYGKTLSNPSNDLTERSKSLMDDAMQIYVPKIWFTHFYIVSFCLSLGGIILVASRWDQSVASVLKRPILGVQLQFARTSVSKSTYIWIMSSNFLQASRRVLECLYISKFGVNSKINMSHYLVGVFFYSSVNILPFLHYMHNYENLKKEIPNGPSFWKAALVICIFFFASYQQFKHHNYLASLKKYNRPSKYLFRLCSCPHYFFEIMVYSSQALLVTNNSTLFVLLWVIINLGVSANEIYHYYLENAGKDTTDFDPTHYYRMIPYVY